MIFCTTNASFLRVSMMVRHTELVCFCTSIPSLLMRWDPSTIPDPAIYFITFAPFLFYAVLM